MAAINENGRYGAPNILEEAYRDGHALSSPILMLIDTAIITIKMKPESIVEFEFLPGHIGRTASRENRNKIDLEIFR